MPSEREGGRFEEAPRAAGIWRGSEYLMVEEQVSAGPGLFKSDVC